MTISDTSLKEWNAPAKGVLIIKKSTLNNELAQICNNLFCIIRQTSTIHVAWSPTNKQLDKLCRELETEYNKLFTLIYGDECGE